MSDTPDQNARFTELYDDCCTNPYDAAYSWWNLERELAEAQKDAERYRWLRDVGNKTWVDFCRQWRMSPEQCNETIDAARKGEGDARS